MRTTQGATGILPVLKWVLARHFSLAGCQWHPFIWQAEPNSLVEKGMSVTTLYRGCAARRKRRQGEDAANLVKRTLLELDLIALRFIA